ncbi:MAG: DUF1015 domain-containing protein [Bacteroidales bacterium]|jgi:uncharacterized protein (DUF1015 family)|nr:DUF1015 family protein [Bacteroidales bacterium]MCK9499711.1 DUF1015 family protein [Bacteroidales bacterium]MDY0314634.1 DUF1015 family protein [Bacteroidales bacterium]NLB86282.1 DUF1015 domain-containing protein [Bacteroidales bacterium]
MAVVKPFKGLRPPKHLVENISCLPYDVMNSKEAAEMAKGKKESLLRVTHAEIDLPEGTDVHSEAVYEKAVENFEKMQKEGWLVQDDEAKFYIYAQTMEGRTQYGIVGCAFYEDYFNGIILKHELTRPDKEEDRMTLTKYTNANIEPVFFSYRAVDELDEIIDNIVKNQEAEYDFVAEDGFGHHFWVIDDAEINKRIEELFATKVPVFYVADGHHRTAAASRIGKERAENNPNHTGDEEYNYFMAVIFADKQLKIIDYNRVVQDLNGLSQEEFLTKIAEKFYMQKMGAEIYKPSALHEFSMYIDGNWYKLNAKPGTYDDDDPIKILDVNVMSKYILDDILGIKDLRRSNRIDFVGGIRGLGELKKRVDSGEMKVAFALYPVSMDQLLNISDTGNIMPPKTTWFEPKLRSGLAIHKL